MNLTTEDELRLRVLLANARAVRIDESRCVVYGCADANEYQVQLNPDVSAEKYVQRVRAFLSTTVLGSPRHFPAHLRRWAGQGQFDNAPLDKLLLLGDADALFAAANSPRVTEELARYIWWAAPEADIARALLRHPPVVSSVVGKNIAQWLLEYLPFETDTGTSLHSLLALLQPGLLPEHSRHQLWVRGRRKTVIRVAFIRACPNELAELNDGAAAEVPAVNEAQRPCDWRELVRTPAALAFISAVIATLPNVSSQDEAIALIEAIGEFFSKVAMCCESDNNDPNDSEVLAAMRYLATLQSEIFTPLFARSDATGSVLRKQIEPVINPVMTMLAVLARINVSKNEM